MEQFLNKVPPHSIDIEETIISSCMLDPEYAETAVSILKPEIFYKKSHKDIFQAVVELVKDGLKPDIVSLSNHCKKMDILEEAGGVTFLAQITNCPISSNIEFHCNELIELYNKRQLAEITYLIHEQAFSPDSSEKIISSLQEQVNKIENKFVDDIPDMQQMTFDCLEDIEKNDDKDGIIGLKTHLKKLNEMLSGLQDSDLIFIAARPSMGKTALAAGIAQSIAEEYGGIVPFFSYEQTPKKLIKRLLSTKSGISSSKLKKKNLTIDDWGELSKAGEKIATSGLTIIDAGDYGVPEIRRNLLKLRKKGKLRAVFIDYLQLMKLAAHSRQDLRIAKTTRALKLLAKEFNIPFIVLSQLNRELEKRENKEPRLSDLRDGGAIEQDGDVIIFVFRPSVYKPQNGEFNYAKLIIAKNRDGPTGYVNAEFTAKTTKFSNWIAM